MAYTHYALNHAPRLAMVISLDSVRRVFANHWRSVLRMPAGGANAGGSMQTGFEMELVSAAAVRKLFARWPNYEGVKMGHSWEARTMDECASVCAFQDQPAGWGILNGKVAPPVAGSKTSMAILMAAPPITVTWEMRADTTTILTVRAPLAIFTEDATSVTILPPDDSKGNAFYLDPPGCKGQTRDAFRLHAIELTKQLLDAGWPLTDKLGRLGDAVEM